MPSTDDWMVPLYPVISIQDMFEYQLGEGEGNSRESHCLHPMLMRDQMALLIGFLLFLCSDIKLSNRTSL